MYLFRRASSAKPDHLFAALDFAVEVAGLATTIGGRPISVWNARLGQPFGTIGWTTIVGSFADLGELTEKLNADPQYLETVQRGSQYFTTLAEDHMVEIISTSATDPAPKRFYTGLVAVAKNTHLLEAVGFGVKAQAYIAEKTGMEATFGRSIGGSYGEVGWLNGADSLADVDALFEFMKTDAGYHAIAAEGGGLFEPNTGLNTLVERIN